MKPPGCFLTVYQDASDIHLETHCMQRRSGVSQRLVQRILRPTTPRANIAIKVE